MQEDHSFIRYLFNEGIYVVREEKAAPSPVAEAPVQDHVPETVATDVPVEDKSTVTCVVISKEGQSDPTLKKILTAIKVTEVDYVSSFDLRSGHGKYLLFGQETDQSKYVIHQDGNRQLLFSDDMAALEADTTLKRKLWDQLQKMYPSQ